MFRKLINWVASVKKLPFASVNKSNCAVATSSRSKNVINALKVAKKMNIPLVSTIHGSYVANSIFKRFYNSASIKADNIINIIKLLTTTPFSCFVDVYT